MKEIISEILQRKEQQEEDRYFETLNREVTNRVHRRAAGRSRNGTGPPVRRRRESAPPDQGS
jgi:hypothetical protein